MSANAKRMLHWRPTTKQLKWTIAVLIFLVILGFLLYLGYGQEWTGFGQSTREKETTQDLRREKTLWDWLQLLIIPAAVAIGTFVLNRAAKKRDDEAQAKQKAREEAIQEQHAQDAALEAYLERMTHLLLGERLLTLGRDSVVGTVARAQTLTTLSRLGPGRKKRVLQFLHESKLIEKDNPVISLEGADLRKADLSLINLPKVNLSGADLMWANLYGVYMPEANLSGAHLQWSSLSGYLPGANLNNSHLLGATIGASDLGGANLKWAGLFGTDLGRAKHLRQEQIEAAMGDKNTLVPFYLTQPQSWKRVDIATKWRFDEEMGVLVYEPSSKSEGVKERGTTRISLSPGSTSAVLEGSVVRGDRDGYLINAKAGQQMTVSISALEDNAAFQIYGPSGEQNLPGAGARDDATSWTGELPTSGEYMIVVGGTRGNASYKIEVKVI